MSSVRGIAVVALLGLLAGCKHVGAFTWVDQYKEPPRAAKSGYVIGRGDLINVRVWGQDAMSARVRVREDGKITLPFLNDVEAAGLEPSELAQRVQTKLKSYVVSPMVAVLLEEQAPIEVSVVGEVTRPGVYRVDQDAGVLKALASAGGLTPLAGRDRIFVLRQEGKAEPTRIRFTYRALTQAEGLAARFHLRAGDLVVVE